MILGQSVGRNFLNPFSRDPLVSPILNNTSVYVERAKLVVGASCLFISKKVFGSPHLLFHRQQQATAPLLMSTDISSKEVDPAGRNLLPTEEQNSVPVDSISQPQVSRSLPNIILPPTVGNTALFCTRISKDESYEVPLRERQKLEVEQFPTPSKFCYWQMIFRTEVCSGSCHPSDAVVMDSRN